MKKLWIFLALCLTMGLSASGAETKYVALTFDDGPSGPITEALLDGLRDRGAQATFFLCGYRMEDYPSALPRYLSEGHQVGVHSTVHTDMTALSPEDLHRDIKGTAQQIFQAVGVRPTVMRPPGGAYNEAVQLEAAAEGLSVILWSVDPRDWATQDAGAVRAAMASTAGGGDIILMHDLSMSSVEAALALVDDMQARGYSFVTVSRLAELSGQELEPGQVYRRF